MDAQSKSDDQTYISGIAGMSDSDLDEEFANRKHINIVRRKGNTMSKENQVPDFLKKELMTENSARLLAALANTLHRYEKGRGITIYEEGLHGDFFVIIPPAINSLPPYVSPRIHKSLRNHFIMIPVQTFFPKESTNNPEVLTYGAY